MKRTVCRILAAALILLLMLTAFLAQAESAEWVCQSCGLTGNTGNFCPECGAARPSEDWTCPSCGAIHDRDKNAAINIDREGLRLLLSGELENVGWELSERAANVAKACGVIGKAADSDRCDNNRDGETGRKLSHQ